MSIKINYLKRTLKFCHLVLFSDEKFKIDGLKKYPGSEFTYINDLLKTSDLKKFICFELNSKKSCTYIYKKI